MVGNDGVCDIMGAKRVGLHTLYVHSNISPKENGVEIKTATNPAITAVNNALIAGLVAVFISTPLNCIFWGGTTGNVWGDSVFAATQAANMPVVLGSRILRS